MLFYTILLTKKKSIVCVPVGNVCDRKDVRGNLVSLLPLVDLDNLLGIDRQPLVGVHHHAEQAGVGLQHANINQMSLIRSMLIFKMEIMHN